MVASFSEDFKVTWTDPADAGMSWNFDPMHFPRPLRPLAGEALDRIYSKLSGGASRTVLINGYAYTAGMALPPPTPEMMRRGAYDVWQNDHMPRVRDACHRLRGADYDSMSLVRLGDAIEGIVTEVVDTFLYTMTVITAFMMPTMMFVDFVEKELGVEGPRVAATLLQGFENGTAAAGAGLSEMATAAASYPAVAEALRQGNYDDLASVAGGAEFLAQFQSYLDEYGWRAESWGLPQLPTWAENPRIPLMLIAKYVGDPSRSPSTSIERAVQQRREATREVESKLSGEKLDQFRAMLAACENHVAVSEGRAMWQLIIIGSMRVPLLALGRKLVQAGTVDNADEVFYLGAAELKQAAHNPGASLRATVAGRRAAYEGWERLAPPPFLGAPPDASQIPPEMMPLLTRFFGAAPPEIEGRVIKGQAASQGVVRGRARIIHGLSEADLLQQGEILVCTTTAPPWTPLFAIAAGVVTDSGGVLSHSAICAREYAIPCVVATQVATHMIPDGATITVDGSKGTVTIEA